MADTEKVEQAHEEQVLSDEAERWKKEARKWEARATKNQSEAERKLKELEDAQKTELEKALERAQAAEKALENLKVQEELNAYKAKLAAEYGVPQSVLRGSTLEDIEDHAQMISQYFKQQATTPTLAKDGQVTKEKPMTNADMLSDVFKSLI